MSDVRSRGRTPAVAKASGAAALAVRPQSAPGRRSPVRPRAVVAVLLLALALAGGAGYALGHSGGQSVSAVEREGSEAGKAAGARAGAERGFRIGYSEGKTRGQRASYRRAYRRALEEGAQ